MSVVALLVELAFPLAILLAAIATGGLTVWVNRLQARVDELTLAQTWTEAKVWPLLHDPDHASRIEQQHRAEYGS